MKPSQSPGANTTSTVLYYTILRNPRRSTCGPRARDGAPQHQSGQPSPPTNPGPCPRRPRSALVRCRRCPRPRRRWRFRRPSRSRPGRQSGRRTAKEREGHTEMMSKLSTGLHLSVTTQDAAVSLHLGLVIIVAKPSRTGPENLEFAVHHSPLSYACSGRTVG